MGHSLLYVTPFSLLQYERITYFCLTRSPHFPCLHSLTPRFTERNSANSHKTPVHVSWSFMVTEINSQRSRSIHPGPQVCSQSLTKKQRKRPQQKCRSR